MRRRLALTALGTVVLLAAAALLIHAPFVRRAVLRYAIPRLEQQYGVRIEAERLDYNLVARRIGLAGLRVSAPGRQPPFFEARYVTVVVPRQALFGDVSFDEVAIAEGVVRIRTAADGTSNLPDPEGGGGEPPPLRVARLRLAPLRVDVRDEQRGVVLDVPAADVTLTPRDGRVALHDAVLRVGGEQTRIARLEGAARFDGRTLTLSGVDITADEGTARIDGDLRLIAGDPGVDMRVAGSADAARLARWAMDAAAAPRGVVSIEGRVQGPLDGLSVDVVATAPRLVLDDVTFTNVAARARVAPDLLTVDGVEAEMPGGRLTGSLRLPAGETDALQRLTADVRVQMTGAPRPLTLLPIPGESRVSVAGGAWRVDGQHRLGGVAPVLVALRGRVAGEPMRSTVTGRVQVAATDLPALLRALRSARVVDVPPDVVAGGVVRGEMQVSGTLARPRIAFSAASDDLRVATPAAHGPATVAGTFDGGTARYDFEGALTGWQLDPTARTSGTFDAAFRGSGRGADVAASADLAGRRIAWDGRDIGDVTARVDLEGGSAHVVAQVPSFSAGLDARVATSAPYAATIDARVDDFDLAGLLEGVGAPVPLSGRTTLTARAAGMLEDWRRGTARVEIQALDARAGDLPLALVEPAVLRYDGERVVVDRLEASAGETRLAASGAIAAFQPPSGASDPNADGLILTATGDVGEVARAWAATGLAPVPVTGGSGPVALLARVSGSLEAPAVAADVEVGPGSITLAGLPTVRDVRLRTHVENGWVEVRQAEATYQGAELTGDGRVPLRLLGVDAPGAAPGDASLRARLINVTARVLEPFIDAATVGELEGSLDASLAVDSPSLDVADVRGDLQIDRLDLRIASLPVAQRVPTRIVAADGFARIAAWDWAGQGASLGLAGQVRLSDRQSGILASGEVDLRMLTPFVRDAGLSTAGSLRPRLSITGDLADPRIDGDLRVDGGEVRLADPRIVVADLNGRILLTRSTATIASLSGAINGGTLAASGTAQYQGDGSADARLGVDVRGMALEFPAGLRSELNAALELELEAPEAQGRLSGTVTLLRGAYREPLAVVTGLLANLRAARLTSTPGDVGLLDNLALDVRAVTDEDIIVDNNYGRFQLGADLRVIGTAAAPALSGRAELREGGQLFVGRNTYAITAGTIDFASADTIEPILDVRVATRAGGQDIEVALRGTPENLGVVVESTSDSTLSQADLTSLLLTGRTLDELASTDAAIVGAQVLGNLSADVLGFAGRAVGLDTLRVGAAPASNSLIGDTSALTTQIDPTSRLTFGKAIGRSLDVTYSQSLRDGDAQTWIIDYFPKRQIDLRFVSDDDDLSTYGFRHDLTFGAPQRTASPRATAPRRDEPRITGIAFAGELAIPEARLRGVLSLDVGDRFDFVDWQEDRDRLLELHQSEGYLTARIGAARAEGALTYTIAPGPRTAIVMRGATLPSAVTAELRRAWADSFFDGFLEDEAAGIVRRALVGDGYPNAEVVARLTDVGAVRTLTIDATPGERSEAPVPAAAPPPAVGAIAVEGEGAFAEGELLGAAGLQAGMAGDAAAIEAARQRLMSFYRGEGFATATVTARPSPRPDAGVVDVAFVVREGPRQVLAAIAIEGNRGIDADVVERALRLPLGEPLRPAAWLQARTRVFDTGLFRRVDVLSEPIAGAAAAATVPMRMRVVVEEWPRLRARYGFQVAEERPEDSVNGRDLVPGLSGDVTRRTLFGRAATIGAAVELQRRQRLGRLFLNTPTMLGLPVRSAFIAERSRRDFAAGTFVTDVTSLAFEQRARTTPRLNLSYTYRFERNHTYDTDPNPNDPIAFDIEIDLARLTGAAAWDSRDDPSDTTRGMLLSSSFEFASNAIGSDFRYLRSLSQAYYFKPWRGVVLASAARAGVVRGLGGQEVIPSLRFYAGGARTVRGVDEDGLGERDFFGDPKGGESLLVLNQEVRFPLYRWLGGVAFADAGNVFPARIQFGDLAASVGVGLRLSTPFGVLRADVARVLSSGLQQQSGGFSFGIGQSF